MAGIYIHVPFCRKACHYCDFHFSTSLALRSEMVQAIATELRTRSSEIKDTVETIYFGGGTPSVLSENDIEQLLSEVKRNYTVIDNAEITFEANPDDCTPEKLHLWKKSGINRLSIGVQSFRQADLDWMNRSHDSDQATSAILQAQAAGFEDINLDLIYGIPEMPQSVWEQNVAKALQLPINHISAYSLTVEPGTALNHFIKTKQSAPLNDEKAADEFDYLLRMIEAHGWEQYEISNFCQPSAYAKHNTNYWKQKPYVGVGPSAHSFDGNQRRWNLANNPLYLKAIAEETVFWESETLSVKDQVNEHIMLGLRTKWGVDLQTLLEKFGYNVLEERSIKIEQFVSSKALVQKTDRLYLTRTGIMLGDHIASELFMV